MFFYILGSSFWIRSDEKAKNEWAEILGKGLPQKTDVILNRTSEENIKKKKNCLGIIIERDVGLKSPVVALTTFECGRKYPVVCSLDSSKLALPQKRSRFPCVGKKLRTKRNAVEGTTDGKRNGNKYNHHITMKVKL